MDLRAQGRDAPGQGAPNTRRLALGLFACALALETGFLSLLRLERLASHIPDYITHYLLISVPYLVACWLVASGARRPERRLGVRWIWAAAILFRLTVLPLAPSLSDDLVRYRWQGMLQSVGGDPYRDTPDQAAWDGLRDETWSRVTAKDNPSAYGPLLEQLYLGHYLLTASLVEDPWTQVWLFKLPFAFADLAVGWALMALLAAAGRPRSWALVYLWSPLAVIEFWAEGHNDAVAVALVVAALACSLRAKPNWALAALTTAFLCKFWPVVLYPFLLVSRADGRWRMHWRGALGCIPLVLVVSMPYWDSLFHVGIVLDGLFGRWRNNDSVFAVVLHLAGGEFGPASAAIKCLLVLAVAGLRVSRLAPVPAWLATVCALLLLSPNCFPWYLTWMLPLLAVQPAAPLLLWTSLVALAYHVVIGYEASGVWEYDRSLVGLEYAPPLLWLGLLGARRVLQPLSVAAIRVLARRGR